MDQREFAGNKYVKRSEEWWSMHTFWERGKAQSEMERYRKHGMLPGLQLFPEDWWLTSSHDALWSVWVPAGYNLRADQSYKKSHILPSYTVYTVCTQCVHSVHGVHSVYTVCCLALHRKLFGGEIDIRVVRGWRTPWERCQGRWLRCSSCLGHDVVGRPG